MLSSAGESNPAGSPANTNKSTRSAHVNLIWSPVAGSDLGVEYIYADRETEDGLNGHLKRLQASAKYAFWSSTAGGPPDRTAIGPARRHVRPGPGIFRPSVR